MVRVGAIGGVGRQLLFGKKGAIVLGGGATSLPGNFTFTRASSGSRFNASGTLESLSTDVARFDTNPNGLAWRGLLLEPARTNRNRNGNATGSTTGVIGSGGALPTNWSNTGAPPGLSLEVVGSGTEDGISYVDLRWSGTPSSTTNASVRFETVTGVVASTGQTWTTSHYVRLVGGSLTNIANSGGVVSQIQELTAAGANLGLLTAVASSFVPTSAALRTQRSTFTATLGNASTGRVRGGVQFGVTNGAAIDMTLRIGACQLELGGHASSYIATTGSATATRAVDVCTIGTLGSIGFNTTEGTFVLELERGADATNVGFLAVDDGSGSNTLALRSDATTGSTLVFDVQSGGVQQAALSMTGGGSGAVRKVAFAYKLDSFRACLGGGTVQSDTSGTVPTGLTTLRLANALTSGTGNGAAWVRRLVYYPYAGTDAELQGWTV